MFVLVLFYFVSVGAADTSSDCATWPANLKPMRECCQVPVNVNSAADYQCLQSCRNKSSSLSDCARDCYIKTTSLMNGTTINKNVVKKVFTENFLWFEATWTKLVNEAVNKCVYNSTDSLQQDIVKFYACINDHLTDNCIHFAGHEECDESIKHFKMCRKATPKCANPVMMTDFMNCCKMPFRNSEELNGKYRLDCQKKEFHPHKKFECAYNQSVAESGLKMDGAVDYGIVKKMLIESSNNSEVWMMSIEKAVETCEKVVKGKS